VPKKLVYNRSTISWLIWCLQWCLRLYVFRPR